MFNFLWYILTGFVCGLVARAVLPGSDTMGYFATTVVGIVGSMIGGSIGGRFHTQTPGSRVHRAGLVWSVIGAVILLLVIRLVQ